MKQLIERILAFRDERDWKQFHKPKDSAIALTLEATEVLECFRWKTPEECEEYLKTHKDQVADELSDVLFWTLLMIHDLDIDIMEAFEKKMQQNEAKYPVEKAKGRHDKYTSYQE